LFFINLFLFWKLSPLRFTFLKTNFTIVNQKNLNSLKRYNSMKTSVGGTNAVEVAWCFVAWFVGFEFF